MWATGYTGDFSWVTKSLLDATGLPRHAGTAAPVPGLWYVGLRWLTRRSSGNFLGFPIDAAEIARAVRAYLDDGHPTTGQGAALDRQRVSRAAG